MEFGQPADLKNKAASNFNSRFRLEEGDNVVRILFGPAKVQMLYYPTLQEDRETGDMKQRMRILNQPVGGTTPLAVLESLEKRTRKAKGEKDPRSSLSPTTRFLYLIINKESDAYPQVEVAEFPYKVYRQLVAIEESISKKDANKLRHGLIYMYDCIITKKRDPGKSIQFGTSYEVEVDPDNIYTSKVPKSFLGKTSKELAESSKNFSLEKFFTEEEWTAIQESDVDLIEEAQPDTMEQMTEKLEDSPIFLGATNQDGSYRFPSAEQFKEQLEKLGIDYLDTDAEELPAKPKTKKIKAAEEEVFDDDEDEVEEAEFEVIDDDDEDEVTEDEDEDDEDEDEDEDSEITEDEDEDEISEDEVDEDDEIFEDEMEDEPEPEPTPKKKRKKRSRKKKVKEEETEEETEEEEEKPKKRKRKPRASKAGTTTRKKKSSKKDKPDW